MLLPETGQTSSSPHISPKFVLVFLSFGQEISLSISERERKRTPQSGNSCNLSHRQWTARIAKNDKFYVFLRENWGFVGKQREIAPRREHKLSRGRRCNRVAIMCMFVHTEVAGSMVEVVGYEGWEGFIFVCGWPGQSRVARRFKRRGDLRRESLCIVS